MGFTDLHAIANIVNFVIFVVIVAKFAGPPIAKNMNERRQAVLDAIREATEASNQATVALGETKTRLSGVDAELANLLTESKRMGAIQAAVIDEAGKAEAERIRVSAKAEIERERQAAVQEIRSLLMRQAFERAALELQQSMTPERQRELVNGLIQKVGDGSLALK
ncbi:MAG: hypothetical protein JWM80_5215 [Cyanobacteria bacterium RYN_339]|nr:hypothetical protein [Cyanobacteria bacterium RYN_339]